MKKPIVITLLILTCSPIIPVYALENIHIFNNAYIDDDLIEGIIQKAEDGDVDSQASLGFYYGSVKNHSESLKWLRKAAANGHPDAQLVLGLIYFEGKILPHNYQKGMYYFKKSAEQGNPEAQNQIGMAYSKGAGVPIDYEKAKIWFLKAADKGYPNAQHNLGYMYEKGIGVRQNFSQALKWYMLAAEQGLWVSQLNLGRLYAEGKGVKKNYTKAYKWCLIAARKGNEAAIKAKGSIEKEIKDSQLSEARKLAKEWLDSHPNLAKPDKDI